MGTIVVDNLSDTPTGGETDLREAIAAAHSGDTIVIRADTFTVIDMNAPLEIASGKTLTIESNGLVALSLDSFDHGTHQAALSGLTVDQGADLTLSGITLEGGAFGANGASGNSGVAGADGDNGANPGDPGTDGDAATTGIGGNSPLTVSLVDNKGTLTLIQSKVTGALAIGGNGGLGGNQGSASIFVGGNGGNGETNPNDNAHGGDAGNGGDGSDGGLGGNGGSAIGGILNEAGATLNLQDSSIANNRGAGGDGGNGGIGGDGGNGGNGGDAGFGGAGGLGGDGGNGGDGANGGDGGTGIGGIENRGVIHILGSAILTANTGDAGDGGDPGEGGAAGAAGGGGQNLNGVNAADGVEGAEGGAGKGGAAGEASDDLLELGNTVGAFLGAGHLYDFDLVNRPAPTVAVDPQSAQPLTLIYQVDIFGDSDTDGSVGWQVVSGANGPTAADFGGASLPSGTLTFFGGLANVTPGTITLHLSPNADAPPDETFSIVLVNPATGDVLGSQSAIVQDVNTGQPAANADTNTVIELQSVAGNVITGDPDLNGKDLDPDNGALTVVAVDDDAGAVGSPLAGAFGTLTLNADGSYVYDAVSARHIAAGTVVHDVFDYTVQSASGGTDTATLTIDVTGVDSPANISDMNGDGVDDLVFQSQSTVDTLYAAMPGGTLVDDIFPALSGVDATQIRAAGSGDIDGNGMADVVYQIGDNIVGKAAGDIATTFTPMVFALPDGWTVSGVGDVNGDGAADILITDATNDAGRGDTFFFDVKASLATLNTATPHTVASNLATPGADYAVRGVGDVNGDGVSDVVFQSTADGDVIYADMAAVAQHVAASNFSLNDTLHVILSTSVIDASLVVKAVGDLDGDGLADLVVEQESDPNAGPVHSLVLEAHNGGNDAFTFQTVAGFTDYGAFDVRGIADVTGDGIGDILMQYTQDLAFGPNANLHGGVIVVDPEHGATPSSIALVTQTVSFGGDLVLL
jgi:VCBS repeat-containing protein